MADEVTLHRSIVFIAHPMAAPSLHCSIRLSWLTRRKSKLHSIAPSLHRSISDQVPVQQHCHLPSVSPSVAVCIFQHFVYIKAEYALHPVWQMGQREGGWWGIRRIAHRRVSWGSVPIVVWHRRLRQVRLLVWINRTSRLVKVCVFTGSLII